MIAMMLTSTLREDNKHQTVEQVESFPQTVVSYVGCRGWVGEGGGMRGGAVSNSFDLCSRDTQLSRPIAHIAHGARGHRCFAPLLPLALHEASEVLASPKATEFGGAARRNKAFVCSNQPDFRMTRMRCPRSLVGGVFPGCRVERLVLESMLLFRLPRCLECGRAGAKKTSHGKGDDHQGKHVAGRKDTE